MEEKWKAMLHIWSRIVGRVAHEVKNPFILKRNCLKRTSCLEVSSFASLQICSINQNWNLEIPTVQKRSIMEQIGTYDSIFLSLIWERCYKIWTEGPFWTLFLEWSSRWAEKDAVNFKLKVLSFMDDGEKGKMVDGGQNRIYPSSSLQYFTLF